MDFERHELEGALRLVIGAIMESEGVAPSYYIYQALCEDPAYLECLEYYEKLELGEEDETD